MLIVADHDGVVINIEDTKHGSFVGLTLGGVNIEHDIGLLGLLVWVDSLQDAAPQMVVATCICCP